MAREFVVEARANDAAALGQLRSAIEGTIICPEDEGYEAARMVWNGRIDRRPALVVQCVSVGDVSAALGFAREFGLPVAVRGGGHNHNGFGTCDDGLVIDLSPLKSIEIDEERRVVRAGAGLVWREVHQATQPLGLAVPSGPLGCVGIAGLTLGGGIGWLSRKHGLSCDNLLEVEIVTPDGAVRRASTEQNSDLFWGVQGGGGNFGVVTEFVYQAHPVGTVLGGILAYPAEQGREVLRRYRDFAATAPDELQALVLRINLPPAPFLPPALHGVPAIGIAACYAGPIEEGERAIAGLRALGEPLAEMIQPMPYIAIATMFDEMAPVGLRAAMRSGFVTDLSDDLIDTIVDRSEQLPQPISQVQIQLLGGAISRVPAGATAFSHRDKAYLVSILADWHSPEPAAEARNLDWMERFWQAIAPLTSGAYVNFLDQDEGRLDAAYDPSTYERLVTLKRTYDPENVLRLNLNVVP